MFARAPNQPLEPPRRRFGEVLRAEVLAEALGLNPLENGEEENADEVVRRFYREGIEEFDREIEALNAQLERENRPREVLRRYRPDWADENRKIGAWRTQDITGLVGGNDDTIFNNMNDIGSLPHEKLIQKTGMTPELFEEHVRQAKNSGRFPDGLDVAVIDREKGCGRGIPIPLKKKVFVALWTIKQGYDVISGGGCETFGIARKTMAKFFAKWVKWIVDELYSREVFYSAALLKRNASIYAKMGKDGCALSIDGTVIDWANCSQGLRANCRYYKSGFGLNFQISVGPQLRIFHVSNAFGAATNDRTMYNNTDIIDFIRDDDDCKNYEYELYVTNEEGVIEKQHMKGMLIIGDGIYADFEHTITGYKHALPGTPEEGWSRHHGSVRKDVERSIGLLKGRFKILSKKLPFQSVDIIENVVKVCAYFHNRILRHDGRDLFGTEDAHFDVLQNLDADNLVRFEDEDYWLPEGYHVVARAQNLQGNQLHRQLQKLCCAHFWIALQRGEVKWPKKQSEMFPKNEF